MLTYYFGLVLTLSTAISDFMVIVPIDAFDCRNPLAGYQCQTKTGQALNSIADIALICICFASIFSIILTFGKIPCCSCCSCCDATTVAPVVNVDKFIGVQVCGMYIQSLTSNCHTFFLKKTAKKCDNLGTFTQKILFLDYNKTKTKSQSMTI